MVCRGLKSMILNSINPCLNRICHPYQIANKPVEWREMSKETTGNDLVSWNKSNRYFSVMIDYLCVFE